MPIPVQNNAQYGGALINQKYAPLEVNAAEIDNGAQAEYVALFQGRIGLLQNQNILPRQLNLYASNWANIQNNEAAVAALPPIVVISSNRAEWINEKNNTAIELQPGNFVNVNDTAALVAGATPWYAPKRINDANRHVYIVVHREEYEYYQAILGTTGMTIIGWEFESSMRIITSNGSIVNDSYVGFGASRFAAIEFCKYLFNHQIAGGVANPPVPAARQKAWLVDDNVVYVRGFPGFAVAEAAMNNEIWGLGFSGATRNSTEMEIMGLAAALNNASMAPDDLQQLGLLQQCVLWNINQLNAQHLNYSPYFASSNEDTSLSNYLQRQNPSRVRISTGASVFKANPVNGVSIGAENLNFLRQRVIQGFYDIERLSQVMPQQNQGGQQNLNNYITNYVLPNAQANVRDENPIFTQSKAVEQIMAKIVNDRLNWTPNAIFQPNGNNAQPTQHFDV